MKLEPRDAREKTFADDVAGKVQERRVTDASANLFTRGLEMKFRDIDSTQQAARKFSLIDELFATRKSERRPLFFLSESGTRSGREENNRNAQTHEERQKKLSVPES